MNVGHLAKLVVVATPVGSPKPPSVVPKFSFPALFCVIAGSRAGALTWTIKTYYGRIVASRSGGTWLSASTWDVSSSSGSSWGGEGGSRGQSRRWTSWVWLLIFLTYILGPRRFHILVVTLTLLWSMWRWFDHFLCNHLKITLISYCMANFEFTSFIL